MFSKYIEFLCLLCFFLFSDSNTWPWNLMSRLLLNPSLLLYDASFYPLHFAHKWAAYFFVCLFILFHFLFCIFDFFFFFFTRLPGASHTWNVFGFSHRLKRFLFLLFSLWCLCCLMWNDEGSIHKRVLNPGGNWCNSTLFRAVVIWNSSGTKRKATVSQLEWSLWGSVVLGLNSEMSVLT